MSDEKSVRATPDGSTRYVVKRGICYLNHEGANWFERIYARVFTERWQAFAFAATHSRGVKGSCRVFRLVPKGTHERKRAEKDRKLGVEPLRSATCDECPSRAFTRWYSDLGTKREMVAYTLCAKHNDKLIRDNKANRKRLGLK